MLESGRAGRLPCSSRGEAGAGARVECGGREKPEQEGQALGVSTGESRCQGRRDVPHEACWVRLFLDAHLNRNGWEAAGRLLRSEQRARLER